MHGSQGCLGFVTRKARSSPQWKRFSPARSLPSADARSCSERTLGASILIDKPLQPLVTANPALRAVDARLREAFDELTAGNAADAVTDAGTALQMLLDHLGYAGRQLGDQLKAARKGGWLEGVDTSLANAIDSLVVWVTSIRNQRSDAHHGPGPDTRDAELVVRVVGLLVLLFG